MYNRSIFATFRSFHISQSLCETINKGNLAKLRKKTGYTFQNCKKALEASNNDITLAEKWLQDQAKALGWSKALKLEGRKAIQGLIGLCVNKNQAAIVEVNCETDFVAKNKAFQNLVENATQSLFNYGKTLQANKDISKIQISSSDLALLNTPDNQKLADHVALSISSLGENLILRRGFFIHVHNVLHLCGMTHPSPSNPSLNFSSGKYAALIIYSSRSNEQHVQQLGKQLCQHIIGMNPTKIGFPEEDKPGESKEDETIMIHQEFLMDPDVTVGQLLSENDIKVREFLRLECGEKEEDFNQRNESNKVESVSI